MRWTRFAAVSVAVALAAWVAMAAPASAGTPAAVKRLFPGVSALPAADTYAPTPVVELRFRPVPVTVQGVDYRMRLDVVQFRDRYFGRDTVVFADLYRFDGSLVQAHSYSFDAAGVSFSLKRETLASAALDTGSAFSPTVLAGSFTASEPAAGRSCTLTNGNPGTRLHADGTMAWSQFAIDTGTAPFFGVLSSGPVRATLMYDPGCRGSGGGSRGGGLQPCPGKTTISGQTRVGDLGFGIATGYGGGRATLAAIAGSGYDDPMDAFHFGYEQGLPGSDLTVVRHGRGGALARFGSAGSVLMQGTATFRSQRAPRHSRWHRCRAHGRVHRFHWLRYKGRLTADANPLTALFDTGDVALAEPLRADLVIVQYAR